MSPFLLSLSLSPFPSLSSCLFLCGSGVSSPVLQGPQPSKDFCSYNVDSCFHLGPHWVGQKTPLDWGPCQTGLDTPALHHPSLWYWLTLCWLLSSFSLSENREWYQDFSNLHKTELLWDGTEDMKNGPFLPSHETSVKRLHRLRFSIKKKETCGSFSKYWSITCVSFVQ